MAKGSKFAAKSKMDMAMVGVPTDGIYDEKISVPFPLEELADLKLGQEIVITLKGCVTRLEGDEYYSSVSLCVDDKSWRKTSNSQMEGIRKLAGEDDTTEE